jgi:hypothetical protein
MHAGSTFQGNPLASRVSMAALQVLRDEGMIENSYKYVCLPHTAFCCFFANSAAGSIPHFAHFDIFKKFPQDGHAAPS